MAARAGGHSFVGASAATGALVIDVRRLDQIVVDADRVTVGAGTITLAAQQELARSGLALPVGMCPTVGLAGLTLGGGIGVDVRRYGLTCDRLEAADLVLPNGNTVRADAITTPDLLWALRGAGGTTGILTSLTYRACPATAKDVVRLAFPGGQAARVLTAWAQWIPAADRTVFARVGLVAAEDLRCEVLIVCPAGGGARAVADLSAAIGTAPSTEDHRTLEHLDAIDDIGSDKPSPRTTRIAGSDVLAQLSPTVIDIIVELIDARSRSGASGLVLFEPLNGALCDTDPHATAFPWRTHATALEWIVNTPDSPKEAYEWITSAHHALGAHSAGANLNHVEPGDTLQRCFAHNTARLQLIRQTLDPHHQLRWGLNT
ncbi:FAD-binding oxidoreductase [Nocardia suismassiliense]|uniref:FAD-binding oxidoreductase n=1 Tax=Nocardia suismassiliense TaxID=2077092 RepID=A0ABW6R5V7_9NOCA